MEYEIITSLLTDTAKLIALISGNALLLCVLYTLFRTKSAHVLRIRIWRVIFGKHEIQDESVKKFIDERTSLMAYRFNSGINVRTLEVGNRLSQWLKDNDEDIDAIKVAGGYFDQEKLALKKNLPKKIHVVFHGVLLIVLWGVVNTAASWSSSTKGLFTVNETGQWILASSQEVRPVDLKVWSEKIGLSKEQCDLPNIPHSDFSEKDATVACKLLKDDKADELIKNAVKTQKIAFGIVSLLALFLGAFVFMSMRQIAMVWELRDRLNSKSRQIEFDF